jgi:hypothetical protein
MRVYDIRYTLGTGKIIRREATPDAEGYVSFGLAGGGRMGTHFFENEGAAIAAAEARARKKISSLKSQISKLKALAPEVEDQPA